MADATTIILGEGSREQIAYKLMQDVARAEGKILQGSIAGNPNADREWILNTYVECLYATRGVSDWKLPK